MRPIALELLFRAVPVSVAMDASGLLDGIVEALRLPTFVVPPVFLLAFMASMSLHIEAPNMLPFGKRLTTINAKMIHIEVARHDRPTAQPAHILLYGFSDFPKF